MNKQKLKENILPFLRLVNVFPPSSWENSSPPQTKNFFLTWCHLLVILLTHTHTRGGGLREKGGKCLLLLWEKRRTLPGGNDQDDGDKELEGWSERFHYVGPGKLPIGGIKGVFWCFWCVGKFIDWRIVGFRVSSSDWIIKKFLV